MISFTHDELLKLRWLVSVHGPDTLESDSMKFIILKIDRMIAEDGQKLVIHNTSCLRH